MSSTFGKLYILIIGGAGKTIFFRKHRVYDKNNSLCFVFTIKLFKLPKILLKQEKTPDKLPIPPIGITL